METDYYDKLCDLQKNKKIVILGFGTENKQFLDWLINVVEISCSQIIVADISEKIGVDYAVEKFLGEKYLSVLQEKDIEFVIKSPGIWSLLPELVEFRNKNGVDKVISSLVFFIEFFSPKIIGVTGTKGKSTTASIINHLLNCTGVSSYYCGNTTGVSPYKYWTEMYPEWDDRVYFVIELSSFQLQDLAFTKVSPKYSVITNYYIDHQDQHATKEEYWAAKDAIFANSDDGYVVACDSVWKNSQSLKNLSNKTLIDEKDVENVAKLVNTNLIGKHNQYNLTQSLFIIEKILNNLEDKNLVLESIKFNKENYSNNLKNFAGLKHRIEFVHSIVHNNVQINFYDDGYATEPDAVIAAIKALSDQENEFLWLVIAGKDKGSDLAGIIDTINIKEIEGKIFRVDYCGPVGFRMLFEKTGQNQEVINLHKLTDSLENYFKTEFEVGYKDFINNQKNTYPQVILNLVLSPAGSSFDEFKNAAERADWWVEKIKKLK